MKYYLALIIFYLAFGAVLGACGISVSKNTVEFYSIICMAALGCNLHKIFNNGE
jgi:hypothetical protein